jgi:hypothetical protein
MSAFHNIRASMLESSYSAKTFDRVALFRGILKPFADHV